MSIDEDNTFIEYKTARINVEHTMLNAEPKPWLH